MVRKGLYKNASLNVSWPRPNLGLRLFDQFLKHILINESGFSKMKVGPNVSWYREETACFVQHQLWTVFLFAGSYLNDNPQVPWDDLRYIFGEIMYGGHITDPWDRRTNNVYLEVSWSASFRRIVLYGKGAPGTWKMKVEPDGHSMVIRWSTGVVMSVLHFFLRCCRRIYWRTETTISRRFCPTTRKVKLNVRFFAFFIFCGVRKKSELSHCEGCILLGQNLCPIAFVKWGTSG